MAVVIASYADDAILPHASTNRCSYKDRDLQPPVHIAPDLADAAPVSHLYLVQPLEAFFSLPPPCLWLRHQHYSPFFTCPEPLPAVSLAPSPLPSSAPLGSSSNFDSRVAVRIDSPKLVVLNTTGSRLLRNAHPCTATSDVESLDR